MRNLTIHLRKKAQAAAGFGLLGRLGLRFRLVDLSRRVTPGKLRRLGRNRHKAFYPTSPARLPASRYSCGPAYPGYPRTDVLAYKDAAIVGIGRDFIVAKPPSWG